MLDGLDTIAWDQLSHAYGEATDVPASLRAVAAGDGDALDELYGTICHQGDTYDSTVYAVPFLIELLDVEGVDIVGVLVLLGCIAEAGADESAAVDRGVPVYLRLLAGADDEDVRARAATLLSKVVQADSPALRELLECDRDESPKVRASLVLAADAIGVLTVDMIARWLADPHPLPRVAAALAVAGDADEPDADESEAELVTVLQRDVPRCLEGLDSLHDLDGDPLVSVIDRLGGRWELQIRLLTAWMTDEDAEVRKEAVHACASPLRTWRPAAQRLVPLLAARLVDPVQEVRWLAADTLATAGRAARLAADELWALLEREPLERTWPSPSGFALVVLCKLRDPRVAGYLADLLDSGQLSNLDSALEQVGPWAAGCRDALVRVIPSAPAGNIRIEVIGALGRICAADPTAMGDDVVPALLGQCASHPHVTSRVLGDLGPPAAAALPQLHAMLDHTEVVVAMNAARAVWRIAGDPAPLVAAVAAAVRKPGADGSDALWRAGELGPAGAELAGLLGEELRSPHDSALPAAIAYWKVTGDHEPVLPVLLRFVRTDWWGIAAVRCLGEIGPPAAVAVPTLRGAVSAQHRLVTSGSADSWVDEDEAYQDVCAEALARIAG